MILSSSFIIFSPLHTHQSRLRSIQIIITERQTEMESECVADIEDTGGGGGGGGGGLQKPHVRVIVGGGNTRGAVIACKVGLSFWGGVDPSSAEIIDQHHPSRGHTLAKKVCMCIAHLIQTLHCGSC